MQIDCRAECGRLISATSQRRLQRRNKADSRGVVVESDRQRTTAGAQGHNMNRSKRLLLVTAGRHPHTVDCQRLRMLGPINLHAGHR